MFTRLTSGTGGYILHQMDYEVSFWGRSDVKAFVIVYMDAALRSESRNDFACMKRMSSHSDDSSLDTLSYSCNATWLHLSHFFACCRSTDLTILQISIRHTSLNVDKAYDFASHRICAYQLTCCSSIKKALMTLSCTQFAHLEPPYARCTVFFGLEILAYSLGRRAGIPGRAVPQSPHFGDLPNFLRCWYRKVLPGVLTIRTLLERVL